MTDDATLTHRDSHDAQTLAAIEAGPVTLVAAYDPDTEPGELADALIAAGFALAEAEQPDEDTPAREGTNETIAGPGDDAGGTKYGDRLDGAPWREDRDEEHREVRADGGGDATTCEACGRSVAPVPGSVLSDRGVATTPQGDEVLVEYYRCACGAGGEIVRDLDRTILVRRGPCVDASHGQGGFDLSAEVSEHVV